MKFQSGHLCERGYCFAAAVTEFRDEGFEAKPELAEAELALLSAGSRALISQREQAPSPLPDAMNHQPGQREFAGGLRQRVWIVAAFVIGLAGLMIWFRMSRDSKPAGARPQTLAVLPFKMINAEAGDEYLGPGIASAIITSLSNLKQITVRPINATLKYSGAGQDTIEAGRALRVDAVLEGSIRQVGDRARFTERLVRVADSSRLWESTEEFENLLAAQQIIPQKVAEALALKLSEPERWKLAKRHTGDLHAWRLYLKGRYLCSQLMVNEIRQGLGFFEQAVNADPGFAAAHGEMAVHRLLRLNPEPMVEKARKAKAEARRALELDETLAEAHAAMGRAIIFSDWDWAGAEKEYKRAIELNPNLPEAHLWYSNHLSAVGRHDEAIEEMKWAREVDPTSARINLYLGVAFYMARRHEQAIEQFRQTPPDLGAFNYQIYWGIGLACLQQSKYEEAVAAFQKGVARSGLGPMAKAHLAYAYARSGAAAEAQKLLAELAEPAEIRRAPFVILAPAYGCLGDNEKAFALLEKAYEHRDPRFIYLKVDPMFDCLRSDARLADFMRRIGLTP